MVSSNRSVAQMQGERVPLHKAHCEHAFWQMTRNNLVSSAGLQTLMIHQALMIHQILMSLQKYLDLLLVNLVLVPSLWVGREE